MCDGNGNCNAASKCIGVTCSAKSQCFNVGICDMNTGVCSDPFKASGTSCNDTTASTVADVCLDNADTDLSFLLYNTLHIGLQWFRLVLWR